MMEAVIFDMDGLLIDSEPIWRRSHVDTLARYGANITEDQIRTMAGKRTDEIVQYWRGKYNLMHIPNDDLEAQIVAQVLDGIRLKGCEMPGVSSLIKLLESHDIPMAVASSSAPDTINVVLDKLGISNKMQLIHSAKHEEFGKPHPAVFLTTAKRLGVDPAHCIVFEDSLSGVRAAKAAGMKCVAVPEMENINKPEFKDEADLIIDSLEKIKWETLTQLMA
jgi:beta-phosphoglucomutase-like phosphatase (HAD superfamily)